MSTREIHDIIARIKAEGVTQTVAELGELKTTTQATTSAFSSFKAAGAVAAGVLIRDVVRGAQASLGQAIKLGASIETLQAAFNALTRETDAEVLSLDTLRLATQGTVGDVDLLTAANTALALGLPTEDLNDLFAAAQTVGAAMGRTTLQAVNDLTTGIGRQSRLILDNLGIIVSSEKAYEDYAETLGVTSSSLTDAQRKTAFMTAAIAQLNKKSTELEGTTSKAQIAQERFTASMENMKTSVGKLLTPLGAVAPILQGMMPFFGTFAGVLIPGLIQQYGVLGLATQAWAAITSLASSLVTTSILGIPIIGWLAAAALAIAGFKMAWDNNWFGIRDIVAKAVNFIGGIFNKLKGLFTSIGNAWTNFWKRITGASKKAAEEIVEDTEEIEFGGSPGGIRDVIQAVEDLDRVWSRVIPNLEQTRVTFEEPKLPLGGDIDAFERGMVSENQRFFGESPRETLGEALPRTQGTSAQNIEIHFHVQGEFTKETYERIRPELRRDLENVLIQSTTTGSSTDKVILRNS